MNIIAQLQGGLGNQLFQYATARSLSLSKNASLLFDHGWYKQHYQDVTPRELQISLLNTKGVLISYEPPIKRPKRIRRIAQKFWPLNPYIFAEQTPYRFDFRLSKAPAFNQQNLYLMGYWQSYKYFEDIRSILLSELTPKSPLNPKYQDYLKKMRATSSVMIHVRRGDYVHLSSAAKVHGFIGLNYYQIGMNKLLEQNSNIEFFVFSDDLEWAKSNLPFQEKISFIESIDSDDAVVQELELMTHCKYHLIANSSLSWWGAWLRKENGGTVICPKHWTNDLNMNWDDLLPNAWERI